MRHFFDGSIEIGVQVNFPEARELFKKAGATVDDSTRIIKVPPALFQELISQAPSIVTLYGRAENGDHDCEIGGDKVYIGTGGTALNVQDPGENNCRRSRLTDIMKIATWWKRWTTFTFTCSTYFPMSYRLRM